MSRIQTAVIMLLCGLAAVRGARAAPAATPDQQMAPYTSPRQEVPVGEHRAINLVCMGHGSPTVVLNAGLGAWSVGWWAVQPQLASRTRVCAWDRAGFGFSSPSPEVQDTVHTTADLERTLQKAAIGGPYVMVGHSLGAFEALRFTDRHRGNVIGMVLVDPDIPDRAAVEQRVAPLFARLSGSQQHVQQLQECAAGLRSGTLQRGAAQYERCTAVAAALGPDLGAALARLNANPDRLLTQASTEMEHYADAREVVNLRRHYHNMPLIVLTASDDEASTLSGLRGSPGAQTLQQIEVLRQAIGTFLRRGWIPAHDAYAALSTRGRNLYVDCGHNIPISRPEAVISAVNEVITEARSNRVPRP